MSGRCLPHRKCERQPRPIVPERAQIVTERRTLRPAPESHVTDPERCVDTGIEWIAGRLIEPAVTWRHTDLLLENCTQKNDGRRGCSRNGHSALRKRFERQIRLEDDTLDGPAAADHDV